LQSIHPFEKHMRSSNRPGGSSAKVVKFPWWAEPPGPQIVKN